MTEMTDLVHGFFFNDRYIGGGYYKPIVYVHEIRFAVIPWDIIDVSDWESEFAPSD